MAWRCQDGPLAGSDPASPWLSGERLCLHRQPSEPFLRQLDVVLAAGPTAEWLRPAQREERLEPLGVAPLVRQLRRLDEGRKEPLERRERSADGPRQEELPVPQEVASAVERKVLPREPERMLAVAVGQAAE